MNKLENFINWLFNIKEDEETQKHNLNEIYIENAKYIVNGSQFQAENFIHVSIVGNFILNIKLILEEKEEVGNSFKTRANEIKEKYNHKFNFTKK
jgi:hypothetical protein